MSIACPETVGQLLVGQVSVVAKGCGLAAKFLHFPEPKDCLEIGGTIHAHRTGETANATSHGLASSLNVEGEPVLRCAQACKQRFGTVPDLDICGDATDHWVRAEKRQHLVQSVALNRSFRHICTDGFGPIGVKTIFYLMR